MLSKKVLQVKESDFVQSGDDNVYSAKIKNWDFMIWFYNNESTISINNDDCNWHSAICPNIKSLSEAVAAINVFLQRLGEALLCGV